MVLFVIDAFDFFTIGNSVRSYRSKSQLLLSVFVDIKYLLLCTHSSKGSFTLCDIFYCDCDLFFADNGLHRRW